MGNTQLNQCQCMPFFKCYTRFQTKMSDLLYFHSHVNIPDVILYFLNELTVNYGLYNAETGWRYVGCKQTEITISSYILKHCWLLRNSNLRLRLRTSQTQTGKWKLPPETAWFVHRICVCQGGAIQPFCLLLQKNTFKWDRNVHWRLACFLTL